MQMQKDQFLQTLVMEIARGSKFSKRIWKKYMSVGYAIEKMTKDLEKKSAPYIDGLIANHPGMDRKKLNEYIQSDKMPPKMRPDIEKLKQDLDKLISEYKVQVPTFTFSEMKKMNIGLTDLLYSYGLVDKRKFAMFKKPIARVI